MKKYLILLRILKISLILCLIIVEISLYFVIPILLMWSFLDWFLYSKIEIEDNYVKLIPFGIVIILYTTMSFEWRYSIYNFSLILIFILLFMALLISVSIFKLSNKGKGK